MTVALGNNIALPVSSALSYRLAFDTMGKLANYGKLGEAADPDAVIKALFANSEVGAWYDPSDLTTMFQDRAGTTPVTADGQTVGKILDKSGNGKHATAPSDAARPLYKTDGTYHWLQFDGVDDSLSTAAIDFTSTDKMSVFSGLKKVDDTVRIICELSANSNNNNGSFMHTCGYNIEYGYMVGARGDVASNANQSACYYVVTGADTAVIFSGNSIQDDLSTIRRNAVAGRDAVGDKGTGNFGNYPLYIGSRNSSSLYFNSNIYSIIVRGELSTTQEITDTETWIASKTGVTL